MPANTAPKFSYKRDPAGRVACIAVHAIAEFLGYTPDRMSRGDLPSDGDTFMIFSVIMPWFADYYDGWRSVDQQTSGQQAFGPNDPGNRLRYSYVTPARGARPRSLGMSSEHPLSTYQARPGGLREVWDRCYQEILRRIRGGYAISREEAMAWGAVAEAAPALFDGI